jgi:predicted DNA-binding protein with PD1-like motif
MFNVQASIGPVHILKPPFGSDLLRELQQFVLAKNIDLAWLSGVGAVSKANIRYYDQPKQQWIDLEFDKRLEVAGLWGNVSLLNGEPIVHVHIVVADEKGNAYGGHVAEGTVVFNLEILMTTLSGPPVIRRMDPETGLTLWH